jgi:tetratricopeptide (TPR) repeat protein
MASSESQSDKRVFVSYRRKSDSFAARAIAQALSAREYDVFLDLASVDSGRFENVILNEIAMRSHFVVLLSEDWLLATQETEGWCRRELERAFELKKNIVPILIGNVSYQENADHPLLTKLKSLNSLTLTAEYFDAAIDKLTTRFLKQPTLQELEHMTAEEYFLKADATAQEARELLLEEQTEPGKTKFKEAIALYSSAIALNPKMVEAFCNRACAKYEVGDRLGALDDLDQAILLDPGGTQLFENKAQLLQELGRDQDAVNTYHQMFTGKKRTGSGVDLSDPDNAWLWS